ncbi:MAG: SpoIIE family protein phosphatase [Acidobacteriota bacterium]|nr:SpoIIE family protein phosphatase [Acidobacteriota bacterium]
MPRLLFSYNAVLATITVILGLVLSLLLYRIRHKRQHTWWLFMTFLCMTVMMLLFTIALAVDHPIATYGISGIVLIDLSILCLLQFGYTFPTNTRPREAQIVMWINLLVAMAVTVGLVYVMRFDADGWTLVPESWFTFAVLFQFIRILELSWLGFVWTRKILFLENDPSRSSLAKILLPRRATSKTLRAFLFSFSIGLLLPLAIVVEYIGLTDQDTSSQIFVMAVMLLFATFFIAYINHQPEESSFMMKLVGVSLVIVLLTLAVAANIAAGEAREAFHRERLRDVEICRRLVMEDRKDRVPPMVRYVIRRPLTGTKYTTWYQADPHFHVSTIENTDKHLRERTRQMKDLANRLLPLSAGKNNAVEPDPLMAPLVRATDAQALLFHERDIHYDFIHDGLLYQVGFNYLDLRIHMHETNGKMVMVMLVVSLGILLFFPSFMERGVTRPVTALMEGVHEVNNGNLEARVQVHARDEIGFVAEAFNKMVANIAEARSKEVEQERERVRLAAENERKTRELEEARRLQLSMLPERLPEIPGLTMAAFTNPATEVGGDYYDCYLDDNALTVVVGDATGHGLQAGTMVAATKGLFNALAPDHEPVPLLEHISRALSRMGFQSMFMALLIARWRGDCLHLTSAGMPYALHFRAAENRVEQIVLKGLPLGSGLDFPYCQEDVRFDPGDTLLLGSDGLEERFNPGDQMLGGERVKQRFAEIAGGDPSHIIGQLVAMGEDWAAGRSQDDDVTLLVIKRSAVRMPARV